MFGRQRAQFDRGDKDVMRLAQFEVEKWGGRVMKRRADSKAFFPLNSVIFVLLAGMAMTGCATSTALTTAAYKGQADVVKGLLDKGADPNESGACELLWPSVTPLYCATYGGHTEAVKVLVDRGAEVDAREDQVGWTALAVAAHRGHADIAKFLVERGADLKYAMEKIKARDKAGALARLDGVKSSYELLESLANKQQPSRDSKDSRDSRERASPPTLPTALPPPVKSDVPF